MKLTHYTIITICLAFGSPFSSIAQTSHPYCNKKILKQPLSYLRGSELYYLAWVEHGAYAEKGASAKKLLEMKEKSNLVIAEKIAACQEIQVFKNMMTLVLFDLAPDKYVNQTKSLLNEDDREMKTDLEGTWVKTERVFEGEVVDFYFDWGGAASLRLLREGHFTERGIQIVLQLAGSYYSSDRNDAKAVLELFESIPKFNLSTQPKTINEQPWLHDIQRIDKWFLENKHRMIWDADVRRYRLKS